MVPSVVPSAVSSDVPSMISSELPSMVSFSQTDVLELFYEATNGGSWSTNTDWSTSASVCTWHGVICTGGVVTTLSLSNNNLRGTYDLLFY